MTLIFSNRCHHQLLHHPHYVQPHMMRSRVQTPPLLSLANITPLPYLQTSLTHTASEASPAGMTKRAGMTKPAESAVAYVCATSAPDLDTIVHGLIAVRAKKACHDTND